MPVRQQFGHNKVTKGREAWNITESIYQTAQPKAPGVATLNPQAFQELIDTHGVGVRVFRTSYCPNVKSVDGAEHEIDCTICNGSGWVDLEPLCTKAFLQAIALSKLQNVEGLVDSNTVSMTFPTGIELQYFTLVELLDFNEIFIQRVKRAPTGDVDILKYTAQNVNFILDENNTRYFLGQDFKIDPNGDVLWLNTPAASKPVVDDIFTIHYEARVQFRAVRAAHVNRLGQYSKNGTIEFVKFPENWFLSKSFLVKRTNEAGTELKQGPFDSHIIVP